VSNIYGRLYPRIIYEDGHVLKTIKLIIQNRLKGVFAISNLRLSDQQAQELIKVLKEILKKHNVNFQTNPRGSIKLETIDERRLTLHYNISQNIEGKYSIHLMDNLTKHTLIRLNVQNDNTFHKNANGERVYGNRVLVFSSEEYYLKKDGYTHYRAYPLPYHGTLDAEETFIKTLDNFLSYTNTNGIDKINVITTNIQMELKLF
jgi:hypothetical protein